MIPLPELTEQLLDDLGRELGGCDFTGESERRFLAANESCDVQAVPGHGKTTLLAAKLALLSRSWQSRSQGVCVISHTNAARIEVEIKLAALPAVSAFLGYPHFIGTVTAFIDRFVALPYLRGLGWPMQRIDDDVFAAIALSRWRSKPTLLRSSRARQGGVYTVERWVAALDLAADFVPAAAGVPERLAVRKSEPRQPGPQSDSGRELEELKAEIVREGIYRFSDMISLAEQAIERCPTIPERLRNRFPLVLLDEAQDTNGRQLALLDRLFGGGTAYQRLGDQNQTLYEDDSLGPGDYWSAREGVIPLNVTRRFGPDISRFASRLTARAAQDIEGKQDVPSCRALLMFDQASIGMVLPAYAEQVRAHWPDRAHELDIRAVASRHNPAGARGNWPKTLIDYCPHYRSGRGRNSRPATLCSVLRQASILHDSHASPADVMDLVTAGLVSLLRHQNVYDERGNPVSKRTLAGALAAIDPGLPLRIRRLVRDLIIFGGAAWDAGEWGAFCDSLNGLLGANQPPANAVAAFLAFVQEGEDDIGAGQANATRTVFHSDGIPIRLGSVHSVKGKSVDGILVVETEVWRRNVRAMDLATVLPHAFGIENLDFSANDAHLVAATNVFVAATRARQLLALAMRREAASDAMLGAAREQGWIVRDLTA